MAQTTCNVLMIRPCCFGSNAETAASNSFQQACSAAPDNVKARALAEFDGMARELQDAGVRVFSFTDTLSPPKPDAVFPNNWVSFHDNGDVVLYPMHARNRRPERRPEVIQRLVEGCGFRVGRTIDLSWLERHDAYLEGTGSLVFDRVNDVAYAALSPRTHPAALAEFTRQTGIEVTPFETRDDSGQPVYHTNVILSLGERYAVICTEAIVDGAQRRRICDQLARTGRRIIEISLAQARGFAGNVLEVRTEGGPPRIVMSIKAMQAFTPEQLQVLGEHAPPLAVPLATIEDVGGGGARCMLAEIFLPRPGVL